jgi:glycosyltransferase involved in cell wall biosynthesis
MMRRSPIFADVAEIPVIPPIIREVFSLPKSRIAARAALGIDDDRFVIGLSASSLTDPGKGITPFFESLPERAAWLDKTVFLLIGDGSVPIPAGVHAVFSGRVTSPTQLAELYGCCDCFASPSFMETFGMAILEAQACGSPVVAFETGGTPEAIAPSPACHAIPNRDFRTMHELLEFCVKSGPPSQSVRSELSKWVTTRHSPAHIAAKQISIYQTSSI